jgi:serine/threonine protein kinase
MPYTQDEQLFICNQILNKYKILLENNIVHRDLRASKIYLADTLESVKGLAPNILGYELLNLESARKLSATEMRMQEYQDDGRLLMSIRGVPIYSSPDLLNYHLQHQQIGMYNPWHNDRIQLAKMLGMIVSL